MSPFCPKLSYRSMNLISYLSKSSTLHSKTISMRAHRQPRAVSVCHWVLELCTCTPVARRAPYVMHGNDTTPLDLVDTWSRARSEDQVPTTVLGPPSTVLKTLPLHHAAVFRKRRGIPTSPHVLNAEEEEEDLAGAQIPAPPGFELRCMIRRCNSGGSCSLHDPPGSPMR